MLDRADCADFGCHNSIRLETKHFLNTLALIFISFSGRFVFAMQKHYLFFCERSSSFTGVGLGGSVVKVGTYVGKLVHVVALQCSVIVQNLDQLICTGFLCRYNYL